MNANIYNNANFKIRNLKYFSMRFIIFFKYKYTLMIAIISFLELVSIILIYQSVGRFENYYFCLPPLDGSLPTRQLKLNLN